MAATSLLITLILVFDNMSLDLLSKSRIRVFRDKVLQDCATCGVGVIALRINGFYAGSRERIFLWECSECGDIWRKPRPMLKSEPSLTDGQ